VGWTKSKWPGVPDRFRLCGFEDGQTIGGGVGAFIVPGFEEGPATGEHHNFFSLGVGQVEKPAVVHKVIDQIIAGFVGSKKADFVFQGPEAQCEELSGRVTLVVG
jgi:hypothetical protein